MSLALHRSEYFNEDFDLQYRWYLREAGEETAERYLSAVLSTVRELVQQPGLGRERKFADPALHGFRSFRVARPFHRHVIFYRATATELFVERVMHGVRDLPRRLRERPAQGKEALTILLPLVPLLSLPGPLRRKGFYFYEQGAFR